MQFTMSALSLSALGLLITTTTTNALGINCRGSALCDRATTNSKDRIVQIFRDAVHATQKDGSTKYNDGDHIICISQTETVTISGGAGADYEGLSGSFEISGDVDFPAGGVCMFPQGASLSLDQIRPLADALLEHGCSTCGSVPIHFKDQGSNDPGAGILTFNYVENPFCDGECISHTGEASKLRRSAKFLDLH